MKKKILVLLMAILFIISSVIVTDAQPIEAAMADEAESYELQTEYKGRIDDYSERYFEFSISEKSYVSLKAKWKVDSVYDYDCKFSIYSNSGKEVLKSVDVYDDYNSVSEMHTSSAGRILPKGTYYLQVGTGSNGSSTRADFSFELQAEKQIKLSKGSISSLKSPKKGTMVVSCKENQEAIGYRIQYSTDYRFKKNVKTIYSPKKTKKINGLKKGIIYYVKVCPYNVYDDGTYVYGQNSKVKSIAIME